MLRQLYVAISLPHSCFAVVHIIKTRSELSCESNTYQGFPCSWIKKLEFLTIITMKRILLPRNLRLVKSCYCLDTVSLDNSAGLSSEPTAGAGNSRALSIGMGFPSASCNGREGDDGPASFPYFTGERG